MNYYFTIDIQNASIFHSYRFHTINISGMLSGTAITNNGEILYHTVFRRNNPCGVLFYRFKRH